MSLVKTADNLDLLHVCRIGLQRNFLVHFCGLTCGLPIYNYIQYTMQCNCALKLHFLLSSEMHRWISRQTRDGAKRLWLAEDVRASLRERHEPVYTYTLYSLQTITNCRACSVVKSILFPNDLKGEEETWAYICSRRSFGKPVHIRVLSV